MKIIVIGAGHAGVEAALASARMGVFTQLITLDKHRIASMPCNPSIGGPAKGIVVREIDALGGEMAINADKTALQFKKLNSNKGPGVQCLRVQSDKIAYSKRMEEVVSNTENLEIVEGLALRLIQENGKIHSVELQDGRILKADAMILTSGTYMSSKILIGNTAKSEGPDQQATTHSLSESLREMGLKTFRLKTGTPPRIRTDSIDFSKGELQAGDLEYQHFSSDFSETEFPTSQEPCYLIYTQKDTHQIINLNLSKSAMYSGLVEGVGPRYCPSIEDKLVKFADKDRHQIFLEPESKSLNTTYVQGFSTSMPYDIQEKMIRSLPGLENCVIEKYAYAIEYDAIDPTQLYPSLELKSVENLFCAGQINGTSGYEEAAAQGLMAGINAALKLQGKEPLILGRDEAYIGVMIDDLVTKGTEEPYRLLTSRAEHRLLLRHDNAAHRLSEKGHQIGLLSQRRYDAFVKLKAQQAQLLEWAKSIRIKPKDALVEYIVSVGYEPLNEGILVYDLVKRPKIKLKDILSYYFDERFDDEVIEGLEIEIKYEGYIQKAFKEVKRLEATEHLLLPKDINYDLVDNLSIEGRQKLAKIRPINFGQASRISGVNPADLVVLKTYLSRRLSYLVE